MACASPIIYLVSSSGDPLYTVSGSYLTLYPILFGEMPYSVMSRETAPLIYQVIRSVPAAPTNVLTRNVGDGSMEVAWDEPASGVVHHYDVLLSPASGGTFRKANKYPVLGTNAFISNIPFGYTVYTKVRGVDAGGDEGPLSELADDAQAQKSNLQIRFTAPMGDVITEGAVFSALLNDTIVAVRVLARTPITG